MITTITVENFKGVKRQEFFFNRVSKVVDGERCWCVAACEIRG